MIKVLRATELDAAYVAAHATDEGLRELADIYGLTPTEAVWLNMKGSTESWVMKDEEPVCLFGIAPENILERRGYFWIVTTTALCRHRFAFARACKRFLPTIFREYDCLENLVDHRHTEVIKWATWLGARLTPINDTTSRFTLCPPQFRMS